MMKIQDLIGKTIANAKIQKLSKHDDTGFLKLNFSDGSECLVVASYGTYTGNSNDEYPTLISIADKFKGVDGDTLVDEH